eukprot:TRINITY_DN1381_c2_g1_i1.p1 TRINITY_DN1381_c2_g1~~TRINITY_DN1381_c2_g1_i1.p1  ORF type:complete len:708 (+),score=187.87 TRINITY_DN1381_c2_g1_i1:130-2253(+)
MRHRDVTDTIRTPLRVTIALRRLCPHFFFSTMDSTVSETPTSTTEAGAATSAVPFVAERDIELWLRNKLELAWSSANVSSLFSPSLLAEIRTRFPTFETPIKLKILFSFVYMGKVTANECRPEIERVLERAKEDKDEWVKVIAELLSPLSKIDFSHLRQCKHSKDTLEAVEESLREVEALRYASKESVYLHSDLIPSFARKRLARGGNDDDGDVACGPQDNEHFRINKSALDSLIAASGFDATRSTSTTPSTPLHTSSHASSSSPSPASSSSMKAAAARRLSHSGSGLGGSYKKRLSSSGLSASSGLSLRGSQKRQKIEVLDVQQLRIIKDSEDQAKAQKKQEELDAQLAREQERLKKKDEREVKKKEKNEEIKNRRLMREERKMAALAAVEIQRAAVVAGASAAGLTANGEPAMGYGNNLPPEMPFGHEHQPMQQQEQQGRFLLSHQQQEQEQQQQQQQQQRSSFFPPPQQPSAFYQPPQPPTQTSSQFNFPKTSYFGSSASGVDGGPPPMMTFSAPSSLATPTSGVPSTPTSSTTPSSFGFGVGTGQYAVPQRNLQSHQGAFQPQQPESSASLLSQALSKTAQPAILATNPGTGAGTPGVGAPSQFQAMLNTQQQQQRSQLPTTIIPPEVLRVVGTSTNRLDGAAISKIMAFVQRKGPADGIDEQHIVVHEEYDASNAMLVEIELVVVHSAGTWKKIKQYRAAGH